MSTSLNEQNVDKAVSSQKSVPETVGAAMLLLLLLIVFLWPAVFGGRLLLPTDIIFDVDPLWQPLAPEGYDRPANPALSDQVLQFFPWRVFTLHSLDEGHLPLWNPHTNGGQPFVGNAQSGIFNPFNLIGYFLPLRVSHVITTILRLFVAGFFTFLFAREVGLERPGALLAMIAFTFSGPMIVWVGYPLASVVVWLPAMLFTIEKALARTSVPYTLACGLVIGAQFTGGHPETSFPVVLVWAAYALWRAVALGGWQRSRLFPYLLRIAGSATIGGALAAVQLLPFVDALLQSATLSTRQAGAAMSTFTLDKLFEWHHWPTAITAILPDYFGTPLDDSYWFPYSNYIEQNAYAGILALALAVTVSLHNLRRRTCPRRKHVVFFALMAVVCLGIAIRLPLLNVVGLLPLFNISENGRLRLVYVFAVALLAGLGLDEVIGGQAKRSRDTLLILVILALTSLFLIALAYAGFAIFKDGVIRSGRAFMESNWGTPGFSHQLEYYYDVVQTRYEKKLAMYIPSNLGMYLPVLIAFAWFVLRRWAQGSGTNRRTWTLAALGLTVFDAFLTGMSFNPTTLPQDVYPTPGAIAFLQQDADLYRINGTGLILDPNSSMVYGLSDVRGYDAIASRRYLDLLNRLGGHHNFHSHSLFVSVESPLLDLLNVKYVLTEDELDGRWELAYQDAGPVKIYRNRDVLPRAFVVHQAEIVGTAAQSLERITDRTFDFYEKVVLEQRPPGWSTTPEPPPTGADVEIVDYEPNRVRIAAQTESDGLLVLTDTYAPGWKALVDGRATPVYVADHAFRAVVVPAGSHQIEFIYRPLSFQIGAGISLLTALALALGLLVPQIVRITRGDR